MNALDTFLNHHLRPGLQPLMPYSTSPRFTTMLIADYRMKVEWLSNMVVVNIECQGIKVGSFKLYGDSDKERRKALGLAVAETLKMALEILAFEQEKDNGKSPSFVSVHAVPTTSSHTPATSG